MMQTDIKLAALDADGVEKELSLADFGGQKVVLYFYPKDNTSGCTQEACDFRDNSARLCDKFTVIGVSPDSLQSHHKFRDKNNLNFILLADTEHKLAEAFGVWKEKSMYGRKYMGIERSTFILDENGKVVKEWRKVKVNGHVAEIAELGELNDA
jgi:peroxiredoxin Q/BCP